MCLRNKVFFFDTENIPTIPDEPTTSSGNVSQPRVMNIKTEENNARSGATDAVPNVDDTSFSDNGLYDLLSY